MLKRIQHLLFDNLVAKAIALALAFTVWVLVSGRQYSSKEVSVQVTQLNHLRQGLTLKAMQVIPAKVVVSGLRSAIDKMDAVYSTAIDLAKIERSTSLKVSLQSPGQGLKILAGKEVEVRLEIEGKTRK